MVGQYPGQNPEVSGPSSDEVASHLSTLLQNARITMFVSLQSEIPAQNDYDAWNRNGGEVYLENVADRAQFPRPFTHYAPVVESILSASLPARRYNNKERRDCNFLHWPIQDLSVPSNSHQLNNLLLKLLDAMNDDAVVYIHCWGGRGRAGLVSSCLLSLLFPDASAQSILDLVQAGYDSRLGAKDMPDALSRSPQTESQRQFVRAFVEQRQKWAVKK